MNNQTRAMFVAAALSPLTTVPATIPVALFALLEPKTTGQPDSLVEVASSFLFISLFAVPIAYICMLVVGLPAAALALHWRRPGFAPAATVGVFAGLLVWGVLHGSSTIHDIRSAVSMSYYGIVVSVSFVAVFRKTALKSQGA